MVGFQKQNQSETKCHITMYFSLEVKGDTQGNLDLFSSEVKGETCLKRLKTASKKVRVFYQMPSFRCFRTPQGMFTRSQIAPLLPLPSSSGPSPRAHLLVTSQLSTAVTAQSLDPPKPVVVENMRCRGQSPGLLHTVTLATSLNLCVSVTSATK